MHTNNNRNIRLCNTGVSNLFRRMVMREVLKIQSAVYAFNVYESNRVVQKTCNHEGSSHIISHGTYHDSSYY
jgi:hypothetical protein